MINIVYIDNEFNIVCISFNLCVFKATNIVLSRVLVDVCHDILYCIILYYIILYYIASHYNIFYYTTRCSIMLYFIILHNFMKHYIISHLITLCRIMI